MAIRGNREYPYYKVDNIATIRDLIPLCLGKYGDRLAFWYADSKGRITKVSYRGFCRDVMGLASFISLKFSGSHIAVMGGNSYPWIVVYMACVYCGCVIVPIDKELPPAQAAGRIAASDCSVLFRAADFRADIPEMRLNGVEVLGFENIDEYIRAGLNDPADSGKNVVPDTLAAIVYTSGTCGGSKGVMLTHGNLARDTVDSSRNLTAASGTVLILPLHHSFGMMTGVFCELLRGYPVFINQSLRYLERDLKIARPRFLTVVPLIAEALYKTILAKAKSDGSAGKLDRALAVSGRLRKAGIDVRRYLFRGVIDALGGRLEMFIVGGSSIRSDVAEGFENFGIKIINGYGITECSPIVSSTRNRHSNFPSVGSVVPECEIRIDSPDGESDGEILVKGPIVSPGYYNDPESTAQAFSGGWFRTGDIGRFDEHGFLYITGRKKNLIITNNGENVSPEELETILYTIPQVREVLVYADDDILTAEIFADTAKADNGRSIYDCVHAINRGLPVYKRISRIVLRDTEFPRTTTKKIIRQ